MDDKNIDSIILKKAKHPFWLGGDRQIHNLAELKEVLKNLDKGSFENHVNDQKNDFANWVKHSMDDHDMAEQIADIKSRDELIEFLDFLGTDQKIPIKDDAEETPKDNTEEIPLSKDKDVDIEVKPEYTENDDEDELDKLARAIEHLDDDEEFKKVSEEITQEDMGYSDIDEEKHLEELKALGSPKMELPVISEQSEQTEYIHDVMKQSSEYIPLPEENNDEQIDSETNIYTGSKKKSGFFSNLFKKKNKAESVPIEKKTAVSTQPLPKLEEERKIPDLAEEFDIPKPEDFGLESVKKEEDTFEPFKDEEFTKIEDTLSIPKLEDNAMEGPKNLSDKPVLEPIPKDFMNEEPIFEESKAVMPKESKEEIIEEPILLDEKDSFINEEEVVKAEKPIIAPMPQLNPIKPKPIPDNKDFVPKNIPEQESGNLFNDIALAEIKNEVDNAVGDEEIPIPSLDEPSIVEIPNEEMVDDKIEGIKSDLDKRSLPLSEEEDLMQMLKVEEAKLMGNMGELETKKDVLKAENIEKKEEIKKVKETIKHENDEIKLKLDEINKAKQEKYDNYEVQITNLKKEIDVLKAQKDHDTSILQEMRSELKDKESRFNQLNDQYLVKKNEFKEFEEDLKEREERLKIREELYEKNKSSYQNLKRKLDADYKERETYVKSLESEFEKNNQEAEKKLKELHKIEVELEYKQKELNTKLAEIKEKENYLNDKEISLQAKETKADKLMNKVKKRETELNDLEKNILSEKRKIEEENKLLKDFESDLKNKENELLVKEKEINIADNSLDFAMKQFKEEKGDVEDEEFHAYLHRKLNEVSNHPKVMAEAAQDFRYQSQYLNPMQNLLNMIDECKNHITNRNMDRAKDSYNTIRERYYEEDLSEADKEIVHNMIRELYDEINIHMLNK